MKKIIIDSRASGYEGEPVRIMAVSLVASGKILLQKTANWREKVGKETDTLLVTDTTRAFDRWDMAFSEKDDMRQLIISYKEAISSGMVKIQDELRRYDPNQVMQMRKLDERGQVMDFDSMSFNNGHMAVMLAVWVAYKAHGGYVMLDPPQSANVKVEQVETEQAEQEMLPFSV